MSESTFLVVLLVSAVAVEVAGRLLDRRERRVVRPRASRCAICGAGLGERCDAGLHG